MNIIGQLDINWKFIPQLNAIIGKRVPHEIKIKFGRKD